MFPSSFMGFFIKYHKYMPTVLRIIFIASIYLYNVGEVYAMGSEDTNTDLTNTKSGSGNNSTSSVAPKSENSPSNSSNKVGNITSDSNARTSEPTRESYFDKRSSTVFQRVGNMLHNKANELREELANPKLSENEREVKQDQLEDLLEQLSLTDKESSKTLRKIMETSSNTSEGTKRSGEESESISKKAK